MDKLNEVTYCGLYCLNCGTKCRLPQKANSLLETMKTGDWEEFGPNFDEFAPFWRFLNSLAETGSPNGCRNGKCGHPECAIRKCAKDKGVEACPMCADFPCVKIESFSKSEPTLLFDGKRMKEVGVEKWIEEQEARRRSGFCYDDIRCGKSNVPLE